MNELTIFDVSPMVHVGHKGRTEKRTFYGVPVGGIQYFLEHLAVEFAERNSVVLCFDSRTFRKDLMPDYKSGRVKEPEILFQLNTIYEGMRSCGIVCEKYEGYEADDIVEWAVQDNYEKFIRGISIYSNDIDICHSVRNGVTFRNLARDGNDIMMSNFSTGIYNGEIIPYNTISAYKVFTGCKSDGIKPFKSACGYTGKQLFSAWCETISKYGDLSNRMYGANPEMVRIFIKGIKAFTQDEVKELLQRVDLIFPATKPEGVMITPVSWNNVDKDKLAHFCSMYGATMALKCMGLRNSTLSESDKEQLRQMSRSLNTGEYAADHNLQHESKSVATTMIDLDSFSRGFVG